jgi:hypothetical protein
MYTYKKSAYLPLQVFPMSQKPTISASFLFQSAVLATPSLDTPLSPRSSMR